MNGQPLHGPGTHCGHKSQSHQVPVGEYGKGEVPSSALEVLAAVAAANVFATSVVVASTIEPM